MADTLGWLRNFIIAFKVGWKMHSAEKSKSLNSGIFKCLPTLEKNEFSILAFSSILVIILSSCTNGKTCSCIITDRVLYRPQW